MYWSNNGTNWTASFNAYPLFNGGVTNIIYNPRYGVWLASGFGNNTLAWSSDGSIWTAIAASPITSRTNGLCASWGSYNMLAVGAGTNTVALSQVAYNVFVGSGTPVFPTLPNALACAYGSDGMFVIGGNSSGSFTNIGNTTVLGSTTNDAGLIVATRYVVGTTGILVNMSINIQTAAGNMIMGIYTDTGNGYPGTLLATSSVTVLSSTGWVTVAPTNLNVAVSSYAVWIVHLFSSASVAVAYSASSGSSMTYSYSFGALPLTWQPGTTGLSVNSYSQYITITTRSNLAYTTDGLNFYNAGSAPFFGAANSVAFNPSLGIWVADGSGNAQLAYSYSGTSWIAENPQGQLTSVARIASYSTTLLSPTSLEGVMALSGTGALPQAQNQVKFFFGGGSTPGAGYGFGYTQDNFNIWSFTLFTTANLPGPCIGISYAPELNTWMAIINTGSGVLSLYATQTPFAQWIIVPGLTPVTSVTWSSTQQYWFVTRNSTTNGCWTCNTPNQCTANSCSSVLTIAVWAAAYSKQQNIWVAVGQGATYQIAFASATNINAWTGIGTQYFGTANTVCFAPSLPLWVIGGTNASGAVTMVTIANPSVGSSPLIPASQPFGSSGGSANGCYYGNGVIVAVGTPGVGGSSIAYSTDGNTWTGIGTSVFSSRGNTVIYDYGSQLWMAGGSGTNMFAKSSTNGQTWTGLASPVLAWSSNVGLAVMPVYTVSNSQT